MFTTIHMLFYSSDYYDDGYGAADPYAAADPYSDPYAAPAATG